MDTQLFSKRGIGAVLGALLDKFAMERTSTFPNLERGQTLVVGADFGYDPKHKLDTYSFILFDRENNNKWFLLQKKFREYGPLLRRRMAFKNLNDKNRRQALIPFLQMAQTINGMLVTFAISASGSKARSLFRDDDNPIDLETETMISAWKPPVFERVMRILHFSSFLLSGLSTSGQDLIWLIDDDEVASNTHQLTLLTNLFNIVWSNYDSHDLNHVRCGTAKSDDGSFSLEDMLAIPDLAAGAVGAAGSLIRTRSMSPANGLWLPLPKDLKWKTRTIISWLAFDACPLRHLTIHLNVPERGIAVNRVRWQAFANADSILIPRRML